jgi:hypothetical protein
LKTQQRLLVIAGQLLRIRERAIQQHGRIRSHLLSTVVVVFMAVAPLAVVAVVANHMFMCIILYSTDDTIFSNNQELYTRRFTVNSTTFYQNMQFFFILPP